MRIVPFSYFICYCRLAQVFSLCSPLLPLQHCSLSQQVSSGVTYDAASYHVLRGSEGGHVRLLKHTGICLFCILTWKHGMWSFWSGFFFFFFKSHKSLNCLFCVSLYTCPPFSKQGFAIAIFFTIFHILVKEFGHGFIITPLYVSHVQ